MKLCNFLWMLESYNNQKSLIDFLVLEMAIDISRYWNEAWISVAGLSAATIFLEIISREDIPAKQAELFLISLLLVSTIDSPDIIVIEKSTNSRTIPEKRSSQPKFSKTNVPRPIDMNCRDCLTNIFNL